MTDILTALFIWCVIAASLAIIAHRFKQHTRQALPEDKQETFSELIERRVKEAVEESKLRDMVANQASQSVSNDIASGRTFKDGFAIRDWKTHFVFLEGGTWGPADTNREKVIIYSTYKEAWDAATNLMKINPMLRLEAKTLRWVQNN